MRLRPDVATTDTDDGTVLLDERSGRYWQLNPTGGLVLRQLLDGRSPAEIAGDLATRYHLDPARVRTDVDAVAGQLRTAGLVETP